MDSTKSRISIVLQDARYSKMATQISFKGNEKSNMALDVPSERVRTGRLCLHGGLQSVCVRVVSGIFAHGNRNVGVSQYGVRLGEKRRSGRAAQRR